MSMKNPNLAVCYLRMSTDQQEFSIDSQWRIVSQWAERSGYTIVKRYEDAGISAMESKLEKRVSFLQMIEDSETAGWGTVLVYDSSRFSRSLRDSIVYKSILKQNGVQVVSVTEPAVDDDTSLIMDAIYGAQNELYIRKLSKNVQRGINQKALRGEMVACPPYGYRRAANRRDVEVVGDEAEVVRYIYAQYLAGRSDFKIAEELSRAGLKTRRGNPFDTRQVRRILQNPAYCGRLKTTLATGETFEKENAWAAIISPEDFERAAKLRAERQSRAVPKVRAPELHSHWLGGKLRCGVCGSCYYRRSNRATGRAPQFMCIGRAHGQCQNSLVIADFLLEEAFFEAADTFMKADASYVLAHVAAPKAPVKTDFDALIQRAEKSLKRAKDAYLAEIDTLEEYRLNKKRLEAEIAQLKAEQQKQQEPVVDIAKTQAAVVNLLDIVRDPTVSTEEKCKAMERSVDRVILGRDRSVAIIFYSFFME